MVSNNLQPETDFSKQKYQVWFQSEQNNFSKQ